MYHREFSAMYQKVYLPGSLPDSCNRKERQNYLAWTTKMDNFLAKILTEQVKEGNRVDGSWKPAAYTTALQVLNENFGGGLTKEHIRSRLKTWKKQFRILKELLSHKGFEWDEAKKMVAADNSVWNNYVKAHPNARQYRGKIIEHYDDWCIIMGDQAIPTISDDGAEVKEILTKSKDGADSLIVLDFQSSDKKAKKLRWTSDMDHYLGSTLVEYVMKGCKHDKTLQRGVLDLAVSALNEKYGPDLTKEHIRNRLRTWKKQYRILKELLSHDGFSWDETRKIIIANNSLWDDYIKINPEAKSFRGRVFENYDQLCIFFRYCNMEALDFPIAVNDGKTGCEGSPLRWTSGMDHCLRRVLVQHVILGNKSIVDNEFNPAAYDAAILALRERFALELTKDQVEDRFKSWKREHCLLRDLLNQGDFKWDEQKKMLVAKDSVWDASVERNPDARLLRGKVIENYDELCVIVDYDNPSESSLNAADDNLDLTADNEAINAGDVCYNQSNNAADNGNYLTWTEEMDTCLSKLLVKQVNLGNKIEKIFKPAAYTTALTFLNERFALDLTKEDIRSRLNTWKKQYGIVKSLLSHDGFEWDEKYKMVVANDFDWTAYTKEHPDARELQAKSIENYNELCMIFGNEQKTEGWSIGKKHDKDRALNNHDTELRVWDDDAGGGDDSSGTDSMEASSQQTGTRPSSSSHSRKSLKRRRNGDHMVQIMSTMAANVARIADALSDSRRPTWLDQVFDVVQTMPGLDDDLILDACEFLSLNENRAVMFMKLDERLRRKWLLKKLRS